MLLHNVTKIKEIRLKELWQPVFNLKSKSYNKYVIFQEL